MAHGRLSRYQGGPPCEDSRAPEVTITEPVPVVVNGEERELPPGSDLAALLELLGVPPRHVAIELNGDLHEGGLDTPLRSGDRIEIVRFVGGG